jgi:hypothetical protein
MTSRDSFRVAAVVAVAAIFLCVTLLVIYVVLPSLGLLTSAPANYGILMAISIAFATHTFVQPRVGLLHAPLFVLLATSLVPQSAPVVGAGAPPEYYFWAAGLLFITLALAGRLPWPRLLGGPGRRGAPLSVILFGLVCVAASFQGGRFGVGLSYIARQLYGAGLFVFYFYAAVVVPVTEAEVGKYFRMLKWTGTVASLYVVARYADAVAPGDVGSFKWGLSIYCAMLAVYCMAEAATSRGLTRRIALALQALLLIANPVVFQARAATGIAAVTSALAFVMLLGSRKLKAALVAASFVIVLATVISDFIAPISIVLPDIGNATHLVPQSILEDPSFLGREGQLIAAVETIKTHPFLGQGLGSALSFTNPYHGPDESAPVDQGLAYILSKLGLLGLITFSSVVLSVFRRSGWPKKNRTHIATFVLFIFCVGFMMSHPVMLQFIGAGFAGIIGGLLYRAPTFRPEV